MNLLRYRSSLSALFILGCSAMALSSCAFLIFVKSPRRVPFDEAALAGYRGPGTGTVIGQLVATDEGVAHPGEGVPITLIPVTAYTREMVDRILGDGENLTASDPRFRKYVRKADADHQGNFVFTQVPAGEYFVSGEASWDRPGSADSYDAQWACERIKVGKGQTVRIKVTHNPQHGNSPINNIWTLE
jgi:hypothetical protein